MNFHSYPIASVAPISISNPIADPITNDPCFFVGRYRVSPLSRRMESGEYLASISLRSGKGSATHDRVFRLSPVFATSRDALDYAASEGRQLALNRAHA